MCVGAERWERVHVWLACPWCLVGRMGFGVGLMVTIARLFEWLLGVPS